MVFYKNVSNLDVQMYIFYSNTMESYLSAIIRKHEPVTLRRKNKWLNVQSVEQMFRRLRRAGKWLAVQTSKGNECSWKSGFTNAQNVTVHSAKCSAKRKSKAVNCEELKITL